MIKYYPKLTHTLSEINGEPTLLVHSMGGCNLCCYNCLNYGTLISNGKNYIAVNEIVETIKQVGELYNYLVLSGGEFLINNTEDIKRDINLIRKVFEGKIIIYTNGYYPHKMLEINDIVDGFHTDMKLPYHLINIDDNDLIEAVLGKKLSQNEISLFIKSIEITIKYDKGLNQIRSVRYPFLNESAFKENQSFINNLNEVYQKQTPYYVNNFVERED